MLTPVVCQTCGCPTGDVEDLFRHLRAELARRVLGARDTAPATAAIDAGLQLDCTEILNSLEVRNDCCRKTLATALIFADYY